MLSALFLLTGLMMDSSAIFSGNSRFATDLRAVIDRSIAIASLPLDQLNRVRSDLQAQSSVLNGLDEKFSDLRTAFDAVEASLGVSSLAASVSDPAIARVTTAAAATPATYTLEVVSLGAQSMAMSDAGLPTVTNPGSESISTASEFTLSINGNSVTITPAAQTLSALAEAINTTAGSDVRASIVNVGPPSAPDYRLVLQSTKLRADTIELSDGSGNLLETLVTGAEGEYKVNGLAAPILTDSRTVTLAPGVSVELLGESTPGVPVTISVERDAEAVRTALSDFAGAYNAVLDALDKQRGEDAGALSGASTISTLARSLREISSYSGAAGPISSLASLGLAVDRFGKLSLDTTKFDQWTSEDLEGVITFLGRSAGLGFRGWADGVLDRLQETGSGILPSAIEALSQQIRRQDDAITREQDRIEELRTSLESRMAAADAMIAALEQKVQYMNSLFEAMRLNAQQLS